MNERQEEISFVVDMISRLCNEYNISLIPCETKAGELYVGILDHTDGKKYVIVTKRDEPLQ